MTQNMEERSKQGYLVSRSDILEKEAYILTQIL